MTLDERLARHFDRPPDVARAAFIAANATVLGDVVLGPEASVFYGAVLRADIAPIRIGARTNLQDGVIVHLADDLGVDVGDDCTVGHGALLHACRIGSACLIGMRATVLDGAVIGDECIIGAGALVTKGTEVPARSMVLGAPAKVVRPLTDAEVASLRGWATKYVTVARRHAARRV